MKAAVPSWLKKGKFWQAVGAIAALILIIMAMAGAFQKRVEPGIVPDEAVIPVPEGAETVVIRTETIRPVVQAVGTVASEELVHLSARIPAYVSEVLVTAGDRVKTGDVLVRLDDRDLRQQLAAAEADLRRAEAELRRTRELFKTEAATQRDLDAAEAAYEGAKARLEGIQVSLSYAAIRAPVDGVVVDRRVEAGDLASPGTVLLAVYDPNRMRLESPVPVRLIGRLKPGAEFSVELERPAGITRGVVSEIVAEVDPRSRTQLVKVSLPDVGGRVLPGTFGRLLIPGDERSAILVPEEAVYRVGQLAMVQAVVDGRLVRRAICLGTSRGGRIEVLAGLDDGDEILLRPVHVVEG